MTTSFAGFPHRDDVVFARPQTGTTRYFTPGPFGIAGTTFQAVAGTDYYTPLAWPRGVVIDSMYANVTASSAGNMRVGMYRAGPDYQPVGAPLFDSGDMATGTTGVKTYTPTTPVYLQRGLYVAVANFSATPTLTGLTIANGTSWAGNALDQVRLFSVARAYAAFPTPGTAWTGTATGSSTLNFVFYRIKAVG